MLKKIIFVLCLALSFPVWSMEMGQPVYHNPIIDSQSLADPHVIKHEGQYYLYATYLDGTAEGGSDHYNVYVSDDMRNWVKGPLIFSQSPNQVWAPDVFFNPVDQQFYLYYTEKNNDNLNIGVALSKSPLGPFVDQGVLLYGALDAHMFLDEDGQYYLYYTDAQVTNPLELLHSFIDGLLPNGRDKKRESILVQKMSSPTQMVGNSVRLISPNVPWEYGPGMDINEAPWMIKEAGIYYLMYSGGDGAGPFYAIGYATSTNPMGPFVKYQGNPILHTTFLDFLGGGVVAPGHHSVVTEENGDRNIFYHQKKDFTSYGFSNRFVCVDSLNIDDGVLGVSGTPMNDF